MKILVAYDGTVQSQDALRYGMEKVKESGGEVIALHVFNRNIFIDYDVINAEEMGRAESMQLSEGARRLIQETGKGLNARLILEEGNPDEETIKYAMENNVDLLLCSPRYKSIIKNFKKLLDKQGKKVYENTIFDETERPKLAMVSLM